MKISQNPDSGAAEFSETVELVFTSYTTYRIILTATSIQELHTRKKQLHHCEVETQILSTNNYGTTELASPVTLAPGIVVDSASSSSLEFLSRDTVDDVLPTN
jgi:hypothetical protein